MKLCSRETTASRARILCFQEWLGALQSRSIECEYTRLTFLPRIVLQRSAITHHQLLVPLATCIQYIYFTAEGIGIEGITLLVHTT